MTVTGYNTYVQDKKKQLLEKKNIKENSQKQIAFITYDDTLNKFVEMSRNIFTEFGFIVHWYHYDHNIRQELDMGIEIAHLRPHYNEIFVFADGKLDWQFSTAALAVAMELATSAVTMKLDPPVGPHRICVFGNNEKDAAQFLFEQFKLGNKVVGRPHGADTMYTDIFENDMTFVFDSRDCINCYPIHKPIYHVFSWNVINQEGRQTYDMGEEIILEVIERVYRRED